jgi:hypothetical protein
MIVGIRVESENIQTGAKNIAIPLILPWYRKIIMVKCKSSGLILCKIEEGAFIVT